MNNFIEIYNNAVTNEYCDRTIEYFERLNQEGRILSRQEHEGVSKIAKDTNNYFSDGVLAFEKNSNTFLEFCSALQSCYYQYANKYGVISSLGKHAISESIKIQKTGPSQGYHVWHCETANILSGRRLMLAILYLNDVEEGGETEFLYQSVRIKPKKGTLILCPGSFTHTHRGNPPLSGEKYIVTTWIEFVE
jgi:hypothetical protein